MDVQGNASAATSRPPTSTSGAAGGSPGGGAAADLRQVSGAADPTITRIRISGAAGTLAPGSGIDGAGLEILEPVRFEPGELVAGTRYRIVSWLGEGGMGVVYECEHVDIERRVALKVLRTGVDPDSRRAQMFREEARAVSRAGRSEDGQASNIVEIYDFGELPDGRMWFAMELLNGRSLARILQEGPMEIPRVIAVLRQLCKGMAAAHDAGIIHRDLKPANIMVVRDRGRDDVVKVVDFGVAAVVAEGDAAEGQLEGTPSYMAPEQALGGAFDHRLDIYALGAVGFHLVSGEPPFMGENVFTLLRRVCRVPPPRPSELDPGQAIPPELEDVLMRCLAKDPAERYEDMRELEAAICEAQIAAKIVAASDDLPLPRVEPLARYEALMRSMPRPAAAGAPRRRVWTLALAVAAALAVGGAWATVRSTDPSAEVDDRVEAHVAAARAAAARAVFLYPPPDEPQSRTAYIELLELERRADELGAGAAEAAARLRGEFAETLVRLGDRYWERPFGRPFAVDYYIASLVFEPDQPEVRARAPITPGALTELQRKAAILDFVPVELTASEPLLALAEQDEQERIRKLERIGRRDDEHGLQTGLRIQRLLEQESAARGPSTAPRRRRAGSGPPPTPPVPEAEAALETGETGETGEIGETDEVDTPRALALVERGRSALRSGQRGRAETLFHRALDEDHRSHQALDGLARVHFARGNYQQALSYGRRAVKRAGNRSSYRIHLGDAYFKVFRYQEAKAQYSRALELGHPEARARLEKVKSKLGR